MPIYVISIIMGVVIVVVECPMTWPDCRGSNASSKNCANGKIRCGERNGIRKKFDSCPNCNPVASSEVNNCYNINNRRVRRSVEEASTTDRLTTLVTWVTSPCFRSLTWWIRPVKARLTSAVSTPRPFTSTQPALTASINRWVTVIHFVWLIRTKSWLETWIVSISIWTPFLNLSVFDFLSYWPMASGLFFFRFKI